MPTPERIQKLQDTVANRQRDIVVVFEDITDPHNIQAVARTCEAFGIQNIHIIFQQTTPFNPHRVGKASSSSANKWVTYHTYSSTKECLDSLQQDGYTLFATALDEQAQSFFETDFLTEKVGLLFGNEHGGLSEEALSCADNTIYIPMAGMTESLNLSVTAALTIAEVTRQRRESGEDWKLSDEKKDDLFQELSQR